MNDGIKNLKGSEKRDAFKWAHKNKMNNAPFYAADSDLSLLSFNPRGVVAYLDYKGSGEGITSTETILYDEWTATRPVYIVEAPDPLNGPFVIKKYLLGGECEYVCDLKDWIDFLKWEASIRREYSQGR